MSVRLMSFFAVCVVSLAAGCSLLSISAVDQQAVSSSTVEGLNDIGIEEGDPAPDFTLKDADGVEHTLSQVLQSENVLLLFYRGDWCPFCIDQLQSINAVLADMESLGVQVIAISPDPASSTQNTARRFGQDFLFLSDPSLQVINSYGIASDQALPHPAQFLIARDGTIKWFYAGEDFKLRPTGEQLLDAIHQHL